MTECSLFPEPPFQMFTLETEFKYKNVQFLIGLGEVYRFNALFL
jgi:hypothetical protein